MTLLDADTSWRWLASRTKGYPDAPDVEPIILIAP
jgi:hypothetical protein